VNWQELLGLGVRQELRERRREKANKNILLSIKYVLLI